MLNSGWLDWVERELATRGAGSSPRAQQRYSRFGRSWLASTPFAEAKEKNCLEWLVASVKPSIDRCPHCLKRIYTELQSFRGRFGLTSLSAQALDLAIRHATRREAAQAAGVRYSTYLMRLHRGMQDVGARTTQDLMRHAMRVQR